MLLSSSVDDCLCFDWSGKQDKAGDFALFFRAAWFFCNFFIGFCSDWRFLDQLILVNGLVTGSSNARIFFTETLSITGLGALGFVCSAAITIPP